MRTYTTRQGDMWDLIAYKVYPAVGGEMCTNILMDSNQEHREVSIFPAGIVLKVPEISVPMVLNLPPWKKIKSKL